MAIQPVLTIQNQVYQALKNEICSGNFVPGQKLLEQQLAEQFQVSRSPIREALRKLVSDGLIEELPNRGVFVKQYTEKDIEEIYEVRVMLEEKAISLLTPESIELHKDEFHEILNNLNNSHKQGDLTSYLEQDTRLHRTLVRTSNNMLLYDLYERLDCQIMQFRRFSLTSKNRFDESLEEHTKTIGYILSGDKEKAIKENSKHLLLAKIKIIEHFRNVEII